MFQDRRKTREGRLVSALLVLGVLALFFVVVGLAAQAFFFLHLLFAYLQRMFFKGKRHNLHFAIKFN